MTIHDYRLRMIMLTQTKLVIVGKQSAGKSSLLQSLTDIPFPVGSRLCTRFATRIVSKRSRPGDSDLVIASIEPGEVDPFNYREDDITTDNFSRKVPSLSAEEFESIVQDVSTIPPAYCSFKPIEHFRLPKQWGSTLLLAPGIEIFQAKS